MAPADPAERANLWPWPPILYAVFAVALIGVEWLALSPRFGGHWLAQPVGIAIFIAGLAFGIWAILTFRRIGTTIDPAGRASHLAAQGPYRLSRNPMYVSALAGFLGVGLYFGSFWTLASVPLLALLLDHLAIRPEEQHLAARFGDAYADYCKTVRRWL
jgi:protein-S-isoprenylcysteine O-methyltransferase Ste14